MKKQIGSFSADILSYLPSFDIAINTPIYLSDSNIAHMQNSHPEVYQKYRKDLKKILSEPDYIGVNQKDSSIEFVREYIIDNEYVKVAVRVSNNGTFYARSMYILNNARVKNFIAKGTLVKLTNTLNQL